MKKIIFATDPHGNIHAYERVFELAEKENLDVILGGDLTPKLVAIKLQDYEEEVTEDGEEILEEDRELKDGEVLPTELLRKEGSNKTYTSSLQRIQKLNEIGGPKKLAEELRKKGRIIYEASTRFYNFWDMLKENEAIDKLGNFFRDNRGAQRHSQPLEMSTEETSFDCVIDLIKEIEEGYNKENYKNKWNSLLSENKKQFGSHPFSRLRLSNVLPTYVKFRGKIEELQRQYEDLVKKLDSPDQEVNDYYRSALEEALLDVKLATSMIEIHGPQIFEQLSKIGVLEKLLEDAEKPEVFIEGQKRFVGEYLRKRLARLKHKHPDINVYTILGNDDRTEVEEEIRNLHNDGLITYLNNNSVELENGLFIFGYPFVRSSKGKYYEGWEKEEVEIAKDLERITSQRNPQKGIFVMHTPPFNTFLDLAYGNEHVGSTAVKDFIEKNHPYLTLHGHVHEAPKTSKGKFGQVIGGTLALNPGSINNYDGKSNFRAVVFDSTDLKSVKYVTR